MKNILEFLMKHKSSVVPSCIIIIAMLMVVLVGYSIHLQRPAIVALEASVQKSAMGTELVMRTRMCSVYRKVVDGAVIFITEGENVRSCGISVLKDGE